MHKMTVSFSRRSFLTHSAMGAIGLTFKPFVSDWKYKSDPPIFKKSLKYGMIKEDLSILDKFKLIKDLGFDGIELDSPSDLNEEEVLQARDETGVEIPGVVNSVHWRSPLSHPDPEIRAICSESMITAIKQCKLFGGTTVLLVPAVVNKTINYQDAYNRSQEEIRKLIPHAEETGIRIALEYVWNNFLLSPVEAARYLDELESPYVGWYFDVGNIIRYGWPEHWIRKLGFRVMKIDVKEYSRKREREEGLSKGFEVELGEGDCDWAAVNLALREIGYRGWGSAEVTGGDRNRLKEISERMDKIFSL